MKENINKENTGLFWSCFIALSATSFGFAIRAMLITEWGESFNLSRTQMGEIMGVGLWPFAISIVLFSLVIDKIGYGKAMVFAFLCHISSVVITLLAKDYKMLYAGTFIFALGNGAVEAAINPVVATLYKENKTKWLNILHAGWPGGMVISGILTMSLGPGVRWQFKVGLLLIPMIIYGIMMIGKKFPVHERVDAGVSFKTMIGEVGIFGALIIISLMVFEVGNFFNFSLLLKLILITVLTGLFGVYSRSPGKPLFIILLLIMFPLATTELGTDSWIVDLMAREMGQMGMQAGWILVYTAVIMTIFRFSAGPLLKVFSPIGLLIMSSFLAVISLYSLSMASGIMIFLIVTVYGFAKAYFWPTMIGIAGERFPKGGALTLNMMTGVGMIGVGIVGTVFLGFVQDNQIRSHLKDYDQHYQANLQHEYLIIEKKSIFGKYLSIDQEKLTQANEEEKSILRDIQINAQKGALKKVALLPAIMLLCYIGLFIYFKIKGGYRSIELKE